jgi:hypothetical protein
MASGWRRTSLRVVPSGCDGEGLRPLGPVPQAIGLQPVDPALPGPEAEAAVRVGENGVDSPVHGVEKGDSGRDHRPVGQGVQDPTVNGLRGPGKGRQGDQAEEHRACPTSGSGYA